MRLVYYVVLFCTFCQGNTPNTALLCYPMVSRASKMYLVEVGNDRVVREVQCGPASKEVALFNKDDLHV